MQQGASGLRGKAALPAPDRLSQQAHGLHRGHGVGSGGMPPLITAWRSIPSKRSLRFLAVFMIGIYSSLGKGKQNRCAHGKRIQDRATGQQKAAEGGNISGGDWRAEHSYGAGRR